MIYKTYEVDLTKFTTYLERQYKDPSPFIKSWERPLLDEVDQDKLEQSRPIASADQLWRLQRRMWNLLFLKVSMLPVSKAHGGGAAFVALVLEVAWALQIPETRAFDIVHDLLELANLNAAITTKDSYRNTKIKLSLQ